MNTVGLKKLIHYFIEKSVLEDNEKNNYLAIVEKRLEQFQDLPYIENYCNSLESYAYNKFQNFKIEPKDVLYVQAFLFNSIEQKQHKTTFFYACCFELIIVNSKNERLNLQNNAFVYQMV